MPSSAGVHIPRGPGAERPYRGRANRGRPTTPRVFSAALVGALSLLLALLGLGDTASGGEAGALEAIARRPAAARLLADAMRAPVAAAGPGFSLVARAAAAATPGRFHAAERGVVVRLPRDAGGLIEVGVVGEARRVGVRRAFASAAVGRLAAGALVYPAAAAGVDAVWFARGGDAEELLVVRAGAAAIAYDLELPRGSTLVAPAGFPGLVEVRDARGSAWLRMTADAAWDAGGRPVPIAVRVDGARVWIDVPAGAERPVIVDPTWFGAGRMVFGRAGHTATLLGSGQVLIAGGRDDDDVKGASAELFDPATGRFTAITTPMTAARAQHSATLLGDGDVLLVGGLGAASEARTAELFNPVTRSFELTRSRKEASARTQHTATLLASGEVLLVGGDPAPAAATSVDIYDRARGGFTRLDATTGAARRRHTATTLGDGRVLLVGGDGSVKSTEIFDPDRAELVAAAPLATPHAGHTATLLRDGLVLIAGGDTGGKKGEDPASTGHQAADLFDPRYGTMTTLKMRERREGHTATLLPSGEVLLVGGAGSAGATAEVFDPALKKFTAIERPSHPHFGGQTATLLPSGDVLIVGGYATLDHQLTAADAEIYALGTSEYPKTATTMKVARAHHTSTRLRSGEVLVIGGADDEEAISAELYDPGTDSFSAASVNPLLQRAYHTATRLPAGQVLVVGGSTLVDLKETPTVLDSAALYEPASGFRRVKARLSTARIHHAATPLLTGEVLITGGDDEHGSTTQLCEIYNFEQDRFRSTTKRMTIARAHHTATRLPSGEVLIVGGTSKTDESAMKADELGSAEIYSPLTGEFRPTGALVGSLAPAGKSTATLLPSGEVLILGAGTPELYDPATGSFRVNVNASGTAPMFSGHTATLLPSGRVFIADGVALPRLYEPISGEFLAIPAPDMQGIRSNANATLLASGEVLVAGGDNKNALALSTTRRWRETPSTLFQPQILAVQASVRSGEAATITGSFGAIGLDFGGGNSGSATSTAPIAVWMPEAGGAVVGGVAAWSPTTAGWTAPHGALVGRGLLFVSAGGGMSRGVDVFVTPGAACSSNLDCGAGQACSAEGRCVDPVDSGAPESGCGIARAPSPGSSRAAALLLGLALAVAVRRGGRGAPTARCRAARCSRRRRARRAPARRRA